MLVYCTTNIGTFDGLTKDGFFEIKSDNFSVMDNYLIHVTYSGDEGNINTGVTRNPGVAKDIIVYTYKDLNIDNVALYYKEEKKEEKKEEPKYVREEINISYGYFTKWTDGDYDYRIQMTPSGGGINITKGELQFYSKEGSNYAHVAGVKDDKTGEFTFDFNPKKLNLTPGTRLRVNFTDSNNNKYMQREVGVEIRKSIGALAVVNAFAGGSKTAVDIIGKVDTLFNLGWSGNFDKLDNNDEGDKVLAVGFNWQPFKEKDKKSELQKRAEALTLSENVVGQKNEEYQKVLKKYADKGKLSTEEQKEIDDAKAEVTKAEEAKKKAKEKYDDLAKDAKKADEKKLKMGGKLEMTLSFSFMMTFGYDEAKADYYFKNLTLTAEVKADASVPKNVTVIEANAYRDCSSIKAVTIKAPGLTSISAGAFEGISDKAIIKLSVNKKFKDNLKKLLTRDQGIYNYIKVK